MNRSAQRVSRSPEQLELFRRAPRRAAAVVSAPPAWRPPRPRRSSRVPHVTRPELNGPAHVVVRIVRGVPGLRTPRAYRVLERCFRRSKEKDGFRLLEFSVQQDHLDFVVEAESKRQLARGMQGLLICIAKSINRFWHRKLGRVFDDRYFAVVVKKFTQLRRTLLYVLNNGRKHGAWSKRDEPDPYSSGRWFFWWRQRDEIRRPLRSAPVAKPQSLPMAYVGSLDLTETPGSYRQFTDEILEWLATREE